MRLSLTKRLWFFYLCHFSHPSSDRPLFRVIWRTRPARIVELGLDDCRRGTRLIRAAQLVRPSQPIFYTGIDLFEARNEQLGQAVPLKQAYQVLRATGASVRLIPGPYGTALARSANTLPGTDLLVIAHRADDRALQSAWFYVPRMLCEGSQVLVYHRRGVRTVFHTLSAEQVAQLASESVRSPRLAA